MEKIVVTKNVNLSKEGTWSPLENACPHTMKLFHQFIDDYKVVNDWNTLFNSNSDYQNHKGKNAIAPKFHDIPLEMQIGIIMAFLSECADKEYYSPRVEDLNIYSFYDFTIEFTIECFDKIEKFLNPNKP